MATENIRNVTHNVISTYSVPETEGAVTIFLEEQSEDIDLELPLLTDGVCVDIYKTITDGYACNVILNNGDDVTGTLATLTTTKDCLRLIPASTAWKNRNVNISI